MLEHVFRKFPKHIEAIQALLQEDASFREICADYGEICIWLDSHDRSEGRSNKECNIAREVIRELEDEINQKLKEYQ
ncbi:hypothetical protein D1AOALGA4SA_4278 [Olavius algarvensis Delta 1 endosymbiont]|nr:hypothetical protein D1AOALGA4SA_4278 [Olavius algarvensis Delta 1 endosymbiont]